MPTIEIEGYLFRFYSSDRGEPPHVHAIKDNSVAKIWLSPVVLEYNRGHSKSSMRKIMQLAQKHQSRLLEAWHEYFSK